MARSRNAQSERDSGEWGHLLAVGPLLGSVLLVLLIGAVLRAERPAPDHAPPPAITNRPQPVPIPPITRSAPVELADDDVDPLVDRASADLQRLDLADDEWTLQLAAICDPQNVARWLAAHGSDDRLFLIPAEIDDRSCFRVCWGRYDSRERADAATLPEPVRRRAGSAGQPRPVGEVVP